MGKYDVVNMKELERADYFYYFMSVGTSIEFTAKLDVTAAIGRCKAFMLFRIYKVINTIENFRYDIFDGKLIRWERIVPTFSSFNKSSKLFFTLYADMTEDERSFDACYKKVVREYADCNGKGMPNRMTVDRDDKGHEPCRNACISIWRMPHHPCRYSVWPYRKKERDFT